MNEGARRLKGLGLSNNEIATTLGDVTKQAVSLWKSGKRVPGIELRRNIEHTYGIPVGAWEQFEPSPAAAQPAPAPTSSPAPTNAPAGESDEDIDAAIDAEIAGEPIEQMRNSLKRIRKALRRADIGGVELARLTGQESQLLNQIANLEERRRAEAQLQEARFVRESTAWRRLREMLREALKPHPEATRAVIAAIEQFEAS